MDFRRSFAGNSLAAPSVPCGRYSSSCSSRNEAAPGESCASYTRDCFAPAPSSASQTAWALLGLGAAGDHYSAQFRQGVEYLLRLQTAEGKWTEVATTGTGFPNVFYLTYAMYRDYFPLLALSQV